jgi:maleate isomerase
MVVGHADDRMGAGTRRLAVIVPSSNSVVERDFVRGVPPGTTIHTARAYLAHTTRIAEEEMLSVHVERAAAELATCRPHVLAFACTSGGAILGEAGEARLEARLEAIAGAPVVSTNRAVAEWLRDRGARRVALVSPYTEELSAAVAETLLARGFEVACVAGMDITDNFAISEVKPDEILRFACNAVDGADFDTLFVTCTNLHAFEVSSQLENVLGVPVVTSNMATLERAAALLEAVRMEGSR